jgi:hypothetical protein
MRPISPICPIRAQDTSLQLLTANGKVPTRPRSYRKTTHPLGNALLLIRVP